MAELCIIKIMEKQYKIFNVFAVTLMAVTNLFAIDKKALEWFPKEIQESSPLEAIQFDFAPGVEYGYVYCKDLLGGPNDLHVVKIDLAKASLRPEIEERSVLNKNLRLRRTSAAADGAKSLFSVNGGFFSWENLIPYYPAKIDGKMLKSETGGNGAGIAFNNDGSDLYLGPINQNEFDRWDNFLCAEGVLFNKVPTVGKSKPGPKTTPDAPHTFMGQDAEKKYLYVFVSGGRQKGKKPSMGLSYPNTADIMLWFDCNHGVNFDGGGSTTMVAHKNALKKGKKQCNPEAHKPSKGAKDYTILNCTSDGSERAILNNVHFIPSKKKGIMAVRKDDSAKKTAK